LAGIKKDRGDAVLSFLISCFYFIKLEEFTCIAGSIFLMICFDPQPAFPKRCAPESGSADSSVGREKMGAFEPGLEVL
jgi:hypothetical protein